MDSVSNRVVYDPRCDTNEHKHKHVIYIHQVRLVCRQ